MTRLWLRCRPQPITLSLDSDQNSVLFGIRTRSRLFPSQLLSRFKQPCSYEMIGEMRMQMGLPELALAALDNVMKLSPNRFNSIANAAAAAAASAFAVTPPLGPQDTAFRSLVSAAPINPLVVPPFPPPPARSLLFPSSSLPSPSPSSSPTRTST